MDEAWEQAEQQKDGSWLVTGEGVRFVALPDPDVERWLGIGVDRVYYTGEGVPEAPLDGVTEEDLDEFLAREQERLR